MGCDIHLYTEMRKEFGGYNYRDEDGDYKTIEPRAAWISTDYLMANPYFGSRPSEPEHYVKHCFDDRNYELFGVLSDVRSSSDNGVMPHDEGVPDDCSKLYKDEVKRWGVDGHTHCYATYDEILDFFKDIEEVNRSGMVSPEDAENWIKNGVPPTAWCSYTNEQGWVKISWTDNAQFGRFLNALKKKYEEALDDVLWVYKGMKNYDELYEMHKTDFRILWFFDN